MTADPNIPGGYTWVEDPDGQDWPCCCGGTMKALKVQPDRSRAYLTRIHLCDNPDCKVQIGGSVTKAGRSLVFL